MDGFDRTVGAVPLRLRGEPGDQPRRHQRTAEGHQRYRPRTLESCRTGIAAVADRLGNVVAREMAEQEAAGVVEREVEDDRTEAGDDADGNPENQPLTQIPRPPDESAYRAAGFAGLRHGPRC